MHFNTKKKQKGNNIKVTWVSKPENENRKKSLKKEFPNRRKWKSSSGLSGEVGIELWRSQSRLDLMFCCN